MSDSAPSQSDEEAAHAVINRLEEPKQWTGINRSVVAPTLAAQFAAVRAEATLAATEAEREAVAAWLDEADNGACKALAAAIRGRKP